MNWFKKLYKELSLIIKNIPYIKYLKQDNEGDNKNFIFESTVKDERPNILVRIGQVLLRWVINKFSPIKARESKLLRSRLHTTNTGHLSSVAKDGVIWFFINGILTDSTILDKNVKGCSKFIGTEVVGIQNDTNGVLSDIGETILGRTFNLKQDVTIMTAAHISTAIQLGYKVRVIGHSQGGIILSNVVELFKASNLDLSNCEFFTIGSAMDSFPEVPFAEHFGNELDPVFRIGTAAYREDISGEVFVRKDGVGHMLNQNYLDGINTGVFCGGKSRLFSHGFNGRLESLINENT